MEKDSSFSVYSRTGTCRSLFKKCFKNPLFSLVPLEIWRDLIVSNAYLKTIVLLSQTCHAFKKIIDDIGENNFNLALSLRKAGEIPLALRCLHKCAENNNFIAMFHLGYAYFHSGWGLKKDEKKAFEWFKKSAELGFAPSMACYARFLFYDVKPDYLLANSWIEKSLSSNDGLAVGFCYFWKLSLRFDDTSELVFKNFESSANEGNEFGQYYLAHCLNIKLGTTINNKDGHFWALKSAMQGFSRAQYLVGRNYRYGNGCVVDRSSFCLV